jgi:hypothetical protein
MKHILYLFCLVLSGYCFAQTPTIQWQKCYGGLGGDLAQEILQTSDGNYVVAGTSDYNTGDVTGNHGADDYWIVKLSSLGAIQWERSIGGTQQELLYSIQQTFDGGFIACGASASNDGDATGNHGNLDCWIVKLSDSGHVQWQKSLGGSEGDAGGCIRQTLDSGYIIAGSSCSKDGDVTGHHGDTLHSDVWIIKLSSTGTLQWEKNFGGSDNDWATAVQQTFDGGYIVS